jgi:hypothetical protein
MLCIRTKTLDGGLIVILKVENVGHQIQQPYKQGHRLRRHVLECSIDLVVVTNHHCSQRQRIQQWLRQIREKHLKLAGKAHNSNNKQRQQNKVNYKEFECEYNEGPD